MHTDAPALDVVKVGQAVHVFAPAALKVLAGQVAHAVVLPWPYVPAGQGWQVSGLLSMKNVPELQQKPTPAAVQRTVPPAAVQPGEEHVVGEVGYRYHSAMAASPSPPFA